MCDAGVALLRAGASILSASCPCPLNPTHSPLHVQHMQTPPRNPGHASETPCIRVPRVRRHDTWHAHACAPHKNGLGLRVVPGRVLTGGPCVVGTPSSLPHPPLHHHRNTCSSLSYCVVPLAILLHFHPFSLRPSPPPSIPLSSLFLQDIMSDAEKKAKGEVSPGRRFGKGGDKRRGS